MTLYAKQTMVSTERSKAEIEKTLRRYGATGFGYGWDETTNRAMITFAFKTRQVRIFMDLPCKSTVEKSFKRRSSPERLEKAWERTCRQSWRALVLVIKAKLEAVESRISTFDIEFMPFLVMPNGSTFGEMVIPKIETALETGRLPLLLPERIVKGGEI